MRQVQKSFSDGSEQTHVLSKLDFTLHAGERIAIMGPSGSGKTTLLYLLGGLDKPDSGIVHINGRDTRELSEAALGTWRNLHLAYVLQQHHLLREFNTLENIAMPLLIRGTPRAEAEERAHLLLIAVGLKDRARHYPEQLSGGQAQRAAIAQALIGRPKCVLMDEPTGNLDHKNSNNIKELLLELSVKHELAMVLATHNMQLAQAMQKRMLLRDGKLKLE
jgi:lipoprotein-releasing system ATP-binding protein